MFLSKLPVIAHVYIVPVITSESLGDPLMFYEWRSLDTSVQKLEYIILLNVFTFTTKITVKISLSDKILNVGCSFLPRYY